VCLQLFAVPYNPPQAPGGTDMLGLRAPSSPTWTAGSTASLTPEQPLRTPPAPCGASPLPSNPHRPGQHPALSLTLNPDNGLRAVSDGRKLDHGIGRNWDVGISIW